MNEYVYLECVEDAGVDADDFDILSTVEVRANMNVTYETEAFGLFASGEVRRCRLISG